MMNSEFDTASSSSWVNTLQDLDPKSFLHRFWSKSTRSDGRLFSTCRPTRITRGILKLRTAGSSLVQMGDTQVVCGITLQIGQPSLPNHGDVVVVGAGSTSLPIQKIMTEMIDLTCLGFVGNNKEAWRLQITFQILQDEGNIDDAYVLAAVAALIDTRLPSTERNKKTGLLELTTNDDDDEDDGIPLTFKFVPIPLTLGIYDNDDTTTFLLADPTTQEEPLLQGHLTVVVKMEDNGENTIVHLQHSCSTTGIQREDLAIGAHMAYGRAKEIRELLI